MEIGFTNLLQDVPTSLPRGPHGFTREEVEASQKNRLMLAFIELAADRGYHDLTIQDIVTKAGTAKGAFYASFSDKEDCFMQTFDMAAHKILHGVVDAVNPVTDPALRIDVGVRAYLQAMIDNPAMVRVFLVESVGAGSRLTERWIIHLETLSTAIVAWRQDSRVEHPELQELTLNQTVAAVSGINQLTWIYAQREGVEALPEFADELVETTIAMLSAPFPTRA